VTTILDTDMTNIEKKRKNKKKNSFDHEIKSQYPMKSKLLLKT